MEFDYYLFILNIKIVKTALWIQTLNCISNVKPFLQLINNVHLFFQIKNGLLIYYFNYILKH